MASIAQAAYVQSAPRSALCPIAHPSSLSSSNVRLSTSLNARSLALRARSTQSAAPRSARLQVRAAVEEITEGDFDAKVLKADSPVIVDFCAKWCGPCRLIAPVMDWAAKEYSGRLAVYKIDVDACPKLVEQYKVYGLPTVVIFDKGVVAPGGHVEGALTSAKLKTILTSAVPALA
eukprot:TRINITY_DN41184_c0_g1_i1.p1 TRINITY_DN41184_c0_g1~~TRINITY_DN41184_c0_g1_i1.p1  ORF type:complete len:205 (+),score=1.22 TRINITY_DN41184_c0_g1_i1:89-616(+)